MDPHLLLPSPATDFIFDSTSTSPFTTAPSSPKSLLPNPKNKNHDAIQKHFQEEPDHVDFAFDFSGQLEPPSISNADELFDSGIIKPLMDYNYNYPSSRGREPTVINIRHKTKTSRSLSPVRNDQKVAVSVSTNQSSQLFGFTWYNKWNLKNLLLFRSTSEGSAKTNEDGLKNGMIMKGEGNGKCSSFRSCDGSVGGSSRRMKRKVSAHELHYTANRAVAEEMRRKTYLPYRSGLLGCLGFGHSVCS